MCKEPGNKLSLLNAKGYSLRNTRPQILICSSDALNEILTTFSCDISSHFIFYESHYDFKAWNVMEFNVIFYIDYNIYKLCFHSAQKPRNITELKTGFFCLFSKVSYSQFLKAAFI